jgi:hypothetical protein
MINPTKKYYNIMGGDKYAKPSSFEEMAEDVEQTVTEEGDKTSEPQKIETAE